MKVTCLVRAWTTVILALSAVGCTHIPMKIKDASARQAELAAAFERSLTEQDIAKGCGESYKAAFEMEETLKQRGGEFQERIKKNFTDSMVRAQAFREKAPEKAAQKEADALQTMIEQTSQLQMDIAQLRAEIETERGKCVVALSYVRDMAHSLSASQMEIDRFIQSDAKTPIETVVFNLLESKGVAMKLDDKTKQLQSKMTGVAEKLRIWEGAFGAIKE